MLSARDLTLRRGADPLFEKVNFTIFRVSGWADRGERRRQVEFVRALSGSWLPTRATSSFRLRSRSRTSSRRSPPSIVRHRIRAGWGCGAAPVMSAIEDAERRDAAMELAELYASLDAIDGYRAPARAAAIMHGLGFEASQHQRAVAEFSGGWRVRLSMARALNSRATCCCWTSPPIISISTRSSGSRMARLDAEHLDCRLARSGVSRRGDRRVLHIENRASRPTRAITRL